MNQLNAIKVQVLINIPAEALVTGASNQFLEVHARVLPLTKSVVYDKLITDGLTLFAFNYNYSDQLVELIDKMCVRMAERIQKSESLDQILYHEMAEHGV